MCILFVYTDPAPALNGFRLILATNRDEYYKRHSQSLQKCEQTEIIAGRDLDRQNDGMWLGLRCNHVTQTIRIAALLNVTGESTLHANDSSRGQIVRDYLHHINDDFLTYSKRLETRHYNAYNFVGIDLRKSSTITLNHYTNVTHPIIESHQEFVGKQILGFGNSPYDRPFAKVNTGRQLFTDIVTKSNQIALKSRLIDELIDLLKATKRHLPDDEMMSRAPLAINHLSSIFVHIEPVAYGTRTHSIILIDSDWNIDFIESTLKEPITCHDYDSITAPSAWQTTKLQAHL